MTTVVGFPSLEDYERNRRMYQREERRPQGRPLPRGRWPIMPAGRGTEVEKAEVKDDFLEEGGDSAECYLMEWSEDDEAWVRKDPEVLVDVFPDAGFKGCAFHTDLVDIVRVTGGEHPRYEALDGGRMMVIATAQADQLACELDTDGAYIPVDGSFPANGPATDDGGGLETTTIQIQQALNNWSEGDYLACWWESASDDDGRAKGRWAAARFGEELIGCGLFRDPEDGNRLKVKATDLAGTGLMPTESGCGLMVNLMGECGIEVTGNQIAFKPESVFGSGFLVSDEDCSVDLDCDTVFGCATFVNGCGINVETDPETRHVTIELVNSDIAGSSGGSLEESGTCGLQVKCSYVVDCIVEELTHPSPGNPLGHAILDMIFNDPALLAKFCALTCKCASDPPQQDCDSCAGAPVYEWDGEEWTLVDPCDCVGEPNPPEADGCVSGIQACGTCTAIDCEFCEGPVFAWVGAVWTLVTDCEGTEWACVDPQPPVGDGDFDGQERCGSCAPPVLTCDDCDGAPVYQWTSGAWVLIDACDCTDGTPAAPNYDGTEEGEYGCGTCTLTCDDCDGAPVYQWDGAAWNLITDGECDCAGTPTEPDMPGTTDGEYRCGTCEESGISACGCTAVPETVTATITGMSCGCAGSPAITLTWDAGNSWWRGSGALGTCFGGSTVQYTLRCVGGNWVLDGLGLCIDAFTNVAAGGTPPPTCSPLNIVFLLTSFNSFCGCAGGYTVTISA